MSTAAVRIAWEGQARLGETPVWSATEARLYWIDSLASEVHRFDPASGRDERLPLGLSGYLGSIALWAGGGLLILCGKQLLRLRPGERRAEPLCDVEARLADNNPNDGKVDPQGRFWFGTMDVANEKPTGSLYRFDSRGLARMDGSFACSNGFAWAPGGRTLYFVDMMPGNILAYDFDGAEGTLSNRRGFLHFDGSEGLPDGICSDAEGGLWMAMWDGGCLLRYDAEGRRSHKVPLPAPRPTCPVFAGPGLRTLYVTSSGDGMTATAPLSGSLFAFEPAVGGLPVPAFAG